MSNKKSFMNISYVLFFIVQIQVLVSFYLHFTAYQSFENTADNYIKSKLNADDVKKFNCVNTCNPINDFTVHNQKTNRIKRENIPEEWQKLYEMTQNIINANRGPPGVPGPPGHRGLHGLPGLMGKPGPQGTPGFDGKPGARGHKGEPGEIGLQGLPGPAGAYGSKGAPGPRGIDGNKGDKGDIGIPGAPGITGKRGMQGEKGEKGDIGNIGVPGFPGPRGPPGYKGSIGLQGSLGEKGDKGEFGFQGIPGAKGARGVQGEKGAKGDMGNPGIPGLVGPPGVAGLRGVPGPEGNRGEKGMKGESGFQGVPGVNGRPGFNGEKGEKGDIGECKCDVENMNVFSIAKYGSKSYPKYSDKTIDCMVEKIKYEKFMDDSQSLLLKDEYLNNPVDNKFWIVDVENNVLNEYIHDEILKKNVLSKSHSLFMLKEQNAYIVYKGSLFFVHTQKNPIIFRYHLNNGTSQIVSIPELTLPSIESLYSTGTKAFDISADENGLWVIFSVPFTKNTGILKLNPDSMTIEHMWNATLSHRNFNKIFVAHEKLYGIVIEDKSVTIPVGVDLYDNRYNNIAFTITKPAKNILSLSFNSRTDKLIMWNETARWEIPFICYDAYVPSYVNVE